MKIGLESLLETAVTNGAEVAPREVKKRTISIPFYVNEKEEDKMQYARIMEHIATIPDIDNPSKWTRSLIERELEMGDVGKTALEFEQRQRWLSDSLPSLREQINSHEEASDEDKVKANDKLDEYEREFTERVEELRGELVTLV